MIKIKTLTVKIRIFIEEFVPNCVHCSAYVIFSIQLVTNGTCAMCDTCTMYMTLTISIQLMFKCFHSNKKWLKRNC